MTAVAEVFYLQAEIGNIIRSFLYNICISVLKLRYLVDPCGIVKRNQRKGCLSSPVGHIYSKHLDGIWAVNKLHGTRIGLRRYRVRVKSGVLTFFCGVDNLIPLILLRSVCVFL